jgi:hypothetical protein
MAMRAFTLAAAGHAASGDAAMYVQDQGDENDCSILLKPMNKPELEVYEQLSTKYANDPVQDFVPAFHGVQHASASNSHAFMRLSNVVDGFKQPKVMDVKLGMRTYLQCETQNTTPRRDLFQKMQEDFPSQLTSAELDMQMVTKSRYMMMRDAQSTSGSLGYRVSGTAGCYDGPGTTSKDRALVSESRDAALRAFGLFAQSASNDTVGPARIARMLVEELRDLRSALEASAFVKEHECIGTSVLLAIDASNGVCRASWIDFAKTNICEDTQGLSHREALSAESQEEGLLVGLDNLISDWEEVYERLEAERRSLESEKFRCCEESVAHQLEQISYAVVVLIHAWLKGTSPHWPLFSSK